MISATAVCAPSARTRRPRESELIVSLLRVVGSAQPGETAYQSGSPAASVSLSSPSVRHGRRPSAGKEQLPAAMPSRAVPT